MKEFTLCFFVAVGFTAGAWIGSVFSVKSERGTVAREFRAAGAFTVARTGFECRPIRK